jgi:hypothetical protein
LIENYRAKHSEKQDEENSKPPKKLHEYIVSQFIEKGPKVYLEGIA